MINGIEELKPLPDESKRTIKIICHDVREAYDLFWDLADRHKYKKKYYHDGKWYQIDSVTLRDNTIEFEGWLL